MRISDWSSDVCSSDLRPTPKDVWFGSMQAFLISTGVVAVAEIGDKTQLLALILGARYRAPVPVLAGILIATVANHGLAALVGGWLGNALPEDWLSGMMAVGVFAVAGGALVPDGAAAGPQLRSAACR